MLLVAAPGTSAVDRATATSVPIRVPAETHIIYIVEPHERSPAYIAAAPCGMATSCTVKVPGRIKPREIGAKAYVAGAVGRSKMQVAVALPGAVEAKAVKARAFTAGTVERSHTAINIVIGGQTT